MAAMVASHPHQHHAAMWDSQRRPEHAMHIAPLQMPSMAAGPEHSVSASRSYQHSPIHLQHMPPNCPPSPYATGPVSYQSNGYMFSVPQTQHYTIPQPHYSIQHTHPLMHSGSYAPSITEAGSHQPRVMREVHQHPITTASQTPSVKADTPSPLHESPDVHIRSKSNSEVRSLESDEQPVAQFSTEIDCLMRTIQAQQPEEPPKPVVARGPKSRKRGKGAVHMAVGHPAKVVKSKSKRQHFCTEAGCNKTFNQKTHLGIHIRSHTGDKPFVCHTAGCGARFSQLGNLKTHERRHTGERPFQCDICGKTFAQRGNVRAHRIVHENKKPFICKLDDCGKQFTQLGNLKSHQNKFHADTVRYLTQKFTNLREGETVSQQDRELWGYFAELYKHSNKGIKGRGKDRKIANVTSPDSALTSFAPSSTAAGPSVSRATTDGSMPPQQSVQRASRSSSQATIPPFTPLEAEQQPARAMHHELPPVYASHYHDVQSFDTSAYAHHKYA